MGKKMIIYLMLCLICVLNLGITAQAEEIITYSEGYYQYHLGEGYVSLCGYFGSQEKVNIPSSLAGRPVIIIENTTFAKNSKVKEIYIPDTVTYIQENTFSGLKNLKKIVTDTVDVKIVADDSVEIEYLRGEPESGAVKQTILTAACTEELTTIDAVLSGGGTYNLGEAITLSAPLLPGKAFLGWYKAKIQITEDNVSTVIEKGERISGKTTCKVTVEADETSFVAVYEEVDVTTTVTLGADVKGVTYTVTSKNGATTEPLGYSGTITCQLGDIVTLTASEDCVGWQNKFGVYVNRKSTYTFTVSGKVEGLVPVYNNLESDKLLVIFESYYKQELDRQFLSTEKEVVDYTIPNLPGRYGYTAIGWRVNDTIITATEEMDINTAVKNKIQDLLKEKITAVTCKAEYQIDENQVCTILVKNGEDEIGQEYTYKLSEIVKVAAQKVEGKEFSHWEDGDGNKMSYSQEYSFYAITDMVLEAVYVTSDEEKEEPVGITDILYVNKELEENTGKDKMTLVSLSTIPYGYTIHKAGIIVAFKDSLSGKELTDKTAQYITADAWSGTTYRYTLTIKKEQDAIICARAYLVYSDAEGTMHTVYGDLIEG